MMIRRRYRKLRWTTHWIGSRPPLYNSSPICLRRVILEETLHILGQHLPKNNILIIFLIHSFFFYVVFIQHIWIIIPDSIRIVQVEINYICSYNLIFFPFQNTNIKFSGVNTCVMCCYCFSLPAGRIDFFQPLSFCFSSFLTGNMDSFSFFTWLPLAQLRVCLFRLRWISYNVSIWQ